MNKAVEKRLVSWNCWVLDEANEVRMARFVDHRFVGQFNRCKIRLVIFSESSNVFLVRLDDAS